MLCFNQALPNSSFAGVLQTLKHQSTIAESNIEKKSKKLFKKQFINNVLRMKLLKCM